MIQEKLKNTYSDLKESIGYTNVMQTPAIKKVVVSVGTGKEVDKQKIQLIGDRLAKITGQKPAVRQARMSIASFKLREGDPVGYQVTLRGKRALDFTNKVVLNALPRTKDFRGIPRTGIDEMGNYTLGIKEHTIFPETSDEEVRDIFGMSITFVTSASSKEEAEKFFSQLGFPFVKNDENK
jgi:large subunit ribosomal protein L5